MKKSEKIEVRVSHEEKARLSGIAERRGVSVSELIREQMAEDIGTLPRVPRWPGYAAVAAGAVALCALLVSLSSSPHQSPTLSDYVEVYVQTDGSNHSSALTADVGESTEFVLATRNDSALRVSMEVERVVEGVAAFAVDVCELKQTSCDPVDSFQLRSSLRTDLRHAGASHNLDTGDYELFLRVLPMMPSAGNAAQS